MPPSNHGASGLSATDVLATDADRCTFDLARLGPAAGGAGSIRLVGLISDTHGLLRPEAKRALQRCEVIVHAGDVGNASVLAALRALAPVTAVRGNVDTGVWARALPAAAVLEIDRVRIYVIHNLTDLDFVAEAAGFRVVVSGHSHRPSVREQNGVLFINPGSAGPRRFGLPVGLGLLSVRDDAVEVSLQSLDT